MLKQTVLRETPNGTVRVEERFEEKNGQFFLVEVRINAPHDRGTEKFLREIYPKAKLTFKKRRGRRKGGSNSR